MATSDDLPGLSGERDLDVLIRTMDPVVRPEEYVVTVGSDVTALAGVKPQATVREDEGLTVVLARPDAERLGLAYDFAAAWITLRAHSSLEAVGLTAAFSTALAAAGVSCNVLAGARHDHLLVPADRAQDALDVLRALARSR